MTRRRCRHTGDVPRLILAACRCLACHPPHPGAAFSPALVDNDLGDLPTAGSRPRRGSERTFVRGCGRGWPGRSVAGRPRRGKAAASDVIAGRPPGAAPDGGTL